MAGVAAVLVLKRFLGLPLFGAGDVLVLPMTWSLRCRDFADQPDSADEL